jgi:hypothetical protein
MYYFVPLLTLVFMFLFQVFSNGCLEVFQLEALVCYLIPSLLDILYSAAKS